jgi:histone H3/H4
MLEPSESKIRLRRYHSVRSVPYCKKHAPPIIDPTTVEDAIPKTQHWKRLQHNFKVLNNISRGTRYKIVKSMPISEPIVEKTAHFEPGAIVAKEIDKYQSYTRPIIPCDEFEWTLNQVCKEQGVDMEFDDNAVLALQMASEAMLADLLNETAQYSQYNTIMPKHLKTATQSFMDKGLICPFTCTEKHSDGTPHRPNLEKNAKTMRHLSRNLPSRYVKCLLETFNVDT